MNSPKTIALAAVMTLTAVSAAAEGENICMHADKAYSPGSIIALGKVPYKCGPSESGQMRWASVSAASDANCVYEGNEYGRGSLIVVDVHTKSNSKARFYAIILLRLFLALTDCACAPYTSHLQHCDSCNAASRNHR